jgi:hypothetical protein
MFMKKPFPIYLNLKILTGTLLYLFVSNFLFAQCTPDYTQTVAGFYPNYLPDAVEGQPYSVDITIVFFDEWTEWGVTCQGDEFQITGITGLPSGMTWASNAGNNTFYPQKNLYGCFNISGTPAKAGSYTVIASGTLKLSGDWLCPSSYDSEAEISFTVNSDISPSAVVTNANCFGNSDGSINLSVSGGVSPYTYLWSNGSTSQDINNLIAGTYTVTITDATTYQKIYTVSVGEPSDIVASGTASVICNTGETAGIDASVSGGTSPYTYSWSNGASTQDISGLSAGTYTLTTTDSKGCKDVYSFTVNSANPISVSSNNTDVSCYSGNNGSIDLTVSGGTLPYTYSWSNAVTTQDISNLVHGTYSVTVSDKNNCQVSSSIVISEPSQIKVTSKITDVICYGNKNGYVDISVYGGITPYTYLWSNGSKKQDLSGIAAGTHTLTVKDANACEKSATVNVNQPSQIVLNGIVTNENCKTNTLGSIDLTTSGGISPYTFTWSNGATTEDINNLAIGTYSVISKDKNLCSATASYSVSTADPFKINSLLTNPSCAGCSDGKISLSIMGGDAPLTYLWSNGSTSKNISNLSAGTYTVTVSDVHACSLTKSYTLSVASALKTSGTNYLQENLKNKIEVFPNPSNDHINIQLLDFNNEKIMIQMSNESGKIVFQDNLQISDGNSLFSIDMIKMDNGIYTILISDKYGKVYQGKTILQKQSGLSY